MTINKIPAIIAFFLTVLLTYAIYALSNDGEHHLVLLLILSFISIGATLFGMMGLSFPNHKNNVNIRVLSIVFALVFILEHAIIATLGVRLSTLIIITGILFLI